MRSTLSIGLLLTIVALPASAAELTAVEKLVIAHECENVLLTYGEKLDAGDVEGVVALFTEDGDVTTGGGHAVGREAIRAQTARVRNPADTTVAQHFFANIRVEVVDANTCKVKAYEALYRYDPKKKEKNTSLAPVLVGRLDNDVFVRTKEGWRYAKRHLVAVSVPRKD